MKITSIFLLLLALLLPALAGAAIFIDWQGRFYVTIPDNWYHAAYSTVSIFLESQGLNPAKFNYDAVLALKTDLPFFKGPYIFLISEPVGRLSETQIDSVLSDLARSRGKSYKSGSLQAATIPLNPNEPVYDRSLKTIAIFSRVRSEVADKVSLELWKFYDGGVAKFLCYVSSEQYESFKPVFFEIFNSFATENIEQMAPAESLKVVNLSDRAQTGAASSPSDAAETGSSETTNMKTIYIFLLAMIVAVVATLVVRILRKKQADIK